MILHFVWLAVLVNCVVSLSLYQRLSILTGLYTVSHAVPTILVGGFTIIYLENKAGVEQSVKEEKEGRDKQVIDCTLTHLYLKVDMVTTQ